MKENEKSMEICPKNTSDEDEENVCAHEEQNTYSNEILQSLLHDLYFDAYFVEAAKLLIYKDRASIGMLQRYFKIGFNRAARIMDQLEEAGVVGPEEGTKPRKVLITADMFEQFIEDIPRQSNREDETEEIPIDAGQFIKNRLNIEIDFSNDGKMLKNLKNIIIPSVSNDIQIESINTLLKYNSPVTMKLILIDDSIITYSDYNGVPQLLTQTSHVQKRLQTFNFLALDAKIFVP